MKYLLAFFLIAFYTVTAFEIEVFRMVGIEQEGQWTGTKISSFQQITTHWQNLATRKCAIIKFSEITLNNIQQLLKNKPSGVLIILDKVNYEEEYSKWNLIQQELGPKGTTIALYFTYDNELIQSHYEELKTNSEQKYQFIVTSTEKKQHLNLEDSYNLLESISNFRQNHPSTLIVLGLDEDLPSAEITNQFISQQAFVYFKLAQSLKESQKQDRNVIFYLTTSQTIDQMGLKQFIKKQEYQRVISTIDQIILLGQINQNQPLIIEHSATLTEQLTQLISNQSIILSQMEGLTIQHKQIDTIKIYTEEKIHLVSNYTENLNQDNQITTLQIISQLTENQNYTQINNETQLEQQIIELFDINRHPSNIQKDSKFNGDLNNILKQLFKHTTKFQYLTKERKYYTSTQIKGQIVKFYSAFINLYLVAGIGIWLTLLYIFVQYVPIFKDTTNTVSKKIK